MGRWSSLALRRFTVLDSCACRCRLWSTQLSSCFIIIYEKADFGQILQILPLSQPFTLYSTRYRVRERVRARSLLNTPLRGFSVIPFLSYKEIISEILPRPGGKDSVMKSSSLLLVPPGVGCINEAGTHPISPSQSTSHQPAIKNTTRQVIDYLHF